MAKPIYGGYRERDTRIALLERRVADLEARLGQNSSNSSLPSSANDLPVERGAGDPEPTWHQVFEMPRITAHVTEHQGHARTFPRCGTVT